MKNQEKLFRLMNHDSSHRAPEFESFPLGEYNEKFETKYTSIEEAVSDDPEYLFTEEEMLDYLKED